MYSLTRLATVVPDAHRPLRSGRPITAACLLGFDAMRPCIISGFLLMVRVQNSSGPAACVLPPLYESRAVRFSRYKAPPLSHPLPQSQYDRPRLPVSVVVYLLPVHDLETTSAPLLISIVALTRTSPLHDAVGISQLVWWLQ